METELRKKLVAELERGGRAYIRNLVAAEQAILKGQFNTAKVLRAAAHSQRIMAMEAARLLEDDVEADNLLGIIKEEIGADKDLEIAVSAKVRHDLRNIIERSLNSLESNSDILETDIAQSLWGCYGCGAILEGDPPHACPICGALSIEFEWFGPFYSSTAEHLGQLKPQEILDILESIPDKVEAIISKIDAVTLYKKASKDEWCIAEIIGHILETDILCAMRIHALLEADGAELPRPMPPWKLHEGKGYEVMQAAELMSQMRAARSQTLDLMRSMAETDWLRKGYIHGAKTTMLDLGTWLANHDRGHLAQIQTLSQS